MPSTDNPNTVEASVARGPVGLTRRWQGELLLAGITLLATLGSGCSAKSVDKMPPKSGSKIESEVKVEPSASEKAYASYMKTLTPEQAALRESLNPDALAKMSDAEMTKAFTIDEAEVVVDGKIDPNLYAEAFTARMQAMNNSGISEIEYAKHGGLNHFVSSTVDEVSKSYYAIQSAALLGHSSESSSASLSLLRGSTVDSVIDTKMKPLPEERYHLRVTVRPGSAGITATPEGDFDARFSVHVSDNWETETMLHQISLSIEQTDSNATWTAKGVHVTEAGTVLPTSFELK